MLTGAFGSMASAAVGGIFKGASKFTQGTAMIGAGRLSGGVGNVLAGGDFWDGARNGLISAGVNHAAHSVYDKIGAHWERTGKMIFKNLSEDDLKHFPIIPEKDGRLIIPKNNVIYRGDGFYYDPNHLKIAPKLIGIKCLIVAW